MLYDAVENLLEETFSAEDFGAEEHLFVLEVSSFPHKDDECEKLVDELVEEWFGGLAENGKELLGVSFEFGDGGGVVNVWEDKVSEMSFDLLSEKG